MVPELRPWYRSVTAAAVLLLALGTGIVLPRVQPSAQAQTVPAPPGWTPLGPMVPSQGGRVQSIAVDPTGKLYAAGPGGVWTSTDNGKTWTTNTDQQASVNIGWIAIDPNRMANPADPNNPFAIYAGTGSGVNGDVDGFPGEGVLKSVDGGATWTQLNPNGILTGAKTSDVEIDSRGSTLYVATNKGVFVSKDGGATFPTTLFAGKVVTALSLDSNTNPTTIFAAVKGEGIERSTNGTDFTVLAGGLPAANQFGNTAIAIAPSNHQIIYVSIGQPRAPSLLTGIYKSVNGGTDWTQLTTIFDFTQYANGNTGQSFANNVIAVKPDDPNTIYGGGVQLGRSTDGGATWTNLSDNNLPTAFAGGDFHALTFDAKNNLFLGSDLGINELTADGKVQNLNGNLNTILFYSGVTQFNNAATILAGAQDNATWVYSGTPQWRPGLNGDGFQAAIDPLNPNVMYGTNTDGVSKTTDAWQTVTTRINPPNVPAGAGPWVKQLTLSPNVATPDAPTVFYGVDKVYTSPDGGTTWNNGNNAYAVAGGFSGVSALAVAPSNPQVVYAGFSDGTMQVSNDKGANWTTIAPPSGAPNCNNCVGMWISHITVDPTNPANVSVTFGAQTFPHTSKAAPHVVQGTSANTATPTWMEVTGNLPNDATNSVIYSGASLVVATDKGVYSGTPNGANTNWVATAPGLPRAPVHDILLTPNGTLVAVTFGRGAWKTTIPTISPNGTGTMTVAPALVKAGATGLTETFTFTAADGGMNNGEVDLSVPAGWTAPTAANSTASTGALAVNGQTIVVTSVTLPVGGMLTITYGQGGTTTAPTANGPSTFVTRTMSGGTPPLTALGSQPTITATTTGGTVPAAPTGVTTTPGDAGVCGDGSGAITVNWNAPPFDGGSAVTSYRVNLSPGGIFSDSTTTSLTNLCGLDKTIAYTATVTATNANGTGPASAPSGAITPAGTAMPPTNVNTVRGNKEIQVNWDPPISDNGAAITGYKITAQPVNTAPGVGAVTKTVPADQTMTTLTGLVDGTDYTISVEAIDQYGASLPADASQGVTPSTAPDVPDAPTNVVVHTGNAQATVSWTAPANNGSPIHSYTVTAEPGGKTATVSGAHTSATVTGLTNGNAYTFAVTATNGIGQGPASDSSAGMQGGLDQSNGAVVGTYPSAPLHVHAVPGNGAAVVSWDEPQSSGGFEMGKYVVVASPGGQHIDADGGTTSITVPGLQNGTSYTFKVYAVTTFGEGPASSPSAPVKPLSCTLVNGSHAGVTMGAGNWCVTGAIAGSLTIGNGASVSIDGATIAGGINANNAGSVRICDSTVNGGTSITGSTGFTLLGDTTDDDCAGNDLHSVVLNANRGGVDLADNLITGVVSVSHTAGTGASTDDTAPEIGYNEIVGNLTCTGNTPAPTNDHRANMVQGAATDQCAGL